MSAKLNEFEFECENGIIAVFISTFERVMALESSGVNPLFVFREYCSTGHIQSNVIFKIMEAFFLSWDGKEVGEKKRKQVIARMIVHDGMTETSELAGALLACVVAGSKKKNRNPDPVKRLRMLTGSTFKNYMQAGLLWAALSMSSALLAVGIMRLLPMLGI